MIRVNLDKAKAIAHDLRRDARAKEFEPFDEAVALRIPGEITKAEAARKEIRKKYDGVQEEIDAAISVEHLKTIVDSLEAKQ